MGKGRTVNGKVSDTESYAKSHSKTTEEERVRVPPKK